MSNKQPREKRSVLDDLGEEITGIGWATSVCMAVTIFLVSILNPEGASSSITVYMASAVYDENDNPDATDKEKLEGAILNAIVFVAVIVVTTFIIVLLFKYGFQRFILAYMGFAIMNTFFFITGLLVIMLCQKAGIHVDIFSLGYMLYNFSVVGTLGVLFVPIPLLLKQVYVVWVGVIVAYIFTWIPDWTAWVLLVAISLYDIVAVLTPNGPLKMLVDLAIERQEALPALLYESRPAGGYRGAGHWGGRGDATDAEQPQQQQQAQAQRLARRLQQQQHHHHPGVSSEVYMPPSTLLISGEPSPLEENSREEACALLVGSGHQDPLEALHQQQQQQDVQQRQQMRYHQPRSRTRTDITEPLLQQDGSAEIEDEQQGLSVSTPSPTMGHHTHQGIYSSSGISQQTMSIQAPITVADALVSSGPGSVQVDSLLQTNGATPVTAASRSPGHAVPQHATNGTSGSTQQLEQQERQQDLPPQQQQQLEPTAQQQLVPGPDHYDDEMGMSDGIKLGLGDFIFYSMLVGKAAMHDMMTAFASFIGIMAGLGLTLLCLATFRRVLPALPFSIALGMMMYFLTRLLLEPHVVPLAMHCTYY